MSQAAAGQQDSDTRERIAKAMIHLVGTQGYHATSVGMVLTEAGVSLENFTSYFIDKEDCFVKVYDELTDDYGGQVLEAYGTVGRWRDRMRAAAWVSLRYLQEDPERTRFMLVEVGFAGEVARAHRDFVLRGFVELIDGARQELPDPDSVPRELADSVMGSIYQTILKQGRRGGLDSGGDYVPQLMYMAVLPYLGQEAAEEELSIPPPAES